MVSFAVNEKKNEWLRERMKTLGIDERDLEEKFVTIRRKRRSEGEQDFKLRFS